MKCGCCGKKKKLFESFENLEEDVDVCVKCSDILYHIQDAVTENDKLEYDIRINSIKQYKDKGKTSDNFINWFENNFLKRNNL